jgi:hypothetical protein
MVPGGGEIRTAIKPATTATLLAVNRVKVTCSGESSAGVISGPKRSPAC